MSEARAAAGLRHALSQPARRPQPQPHHALACSMTSPDNRKRAREDDSCEFMPLSKRINNLHINNRDVGTSGAPRPSSEHNGIVHIDNPYASTSEVCTRPTYDPGVTPQQSRYYFDNKLLFDLYLERLQRTGQPFPQ